MKKNSKMLERFSRLQEAIAATALQNTNLFEQRGAKADYIVGLDVSYSRKYGAVAVAVLVDSKGTLLAYGVAVGEPPLPYIPGYLAFREAPIMYAAYQHLQQQTGKQPDVIMVDGHGLAHPRLAGIALHLGAALKTPSIGVAKKKLVGTIIKKDNNEYIEYHNMIVAQIVKTPTGSKLYVSPGYGIKLGQAVEIVLKNLRRGYRLPIPLHLADTISRSLAHKLDRGAITPQQLASNKHKITANT